MTWIYHQHTGKLYHDATYVATGYAGKDEARNNGSMEGIRDRGPLPRGRYRIAAPRDSVNTGPYVLDLDPMGHDALGRTDFQIHGESLKNPGNASRGCIILARAIREQIHHSGDHELEVVA